MNSSEINQAATWAVLKLSRSFPASFPDAGTTSERNNLYVELLTEHAWITASVWKDGVMYLCWHHEGDYVPPPANLISVCRTYFEAASAKIEDALPTLPPPPVNVAPAIDPTDPYSCTPEERERWAREDVQLNRLSHSTSLPPELLSRMSEEDRTSILESESAAVRVKGWTQLRPIDRRAMEQRVTVMKARGPAMIAEAAARQREFRERTGPRYIISQADQARQNIQNQRQREAQQPSRVVAAWPSAAE